MCNMDPYVSVNNQIQHEYYYVTLGYICSSYV